MHMTVDLSKEKFSLHLIHFIVVQILYERSYLSDISEAILMDTTVANRPHFPLIVSTDNNINVLCNLMDSIQYKQYDKHINESFSYRT